MNEICIDFKNLTLGYQTHAAVHHLSGSVKYGSLTAIVGANESGKSTLLKGWRTADQVGGLAAFGLRTEHSLWPE